MTVDKESKNSETIPGFDLKAKRERFKKRKAPEDGNSNEEKPDWKKLRVARKELKVKRKISDIGSKEVYEIIQKSKSMWEELRRGNCKGERQKELCNDLYNLVQGQIYTMIRAHDTVRIIQTLVSDGDDEVKAKIFTELKDQLLELMTFKYSKFYVIKMLKYGTKKQRQKIIDSVMGHVVKLTKHMYSCDVIETIYNDYANAKQRNDMIQEFYGARFRVLKEDFQSLEDCLNRNPSSRKEILSTVRSNLDPIIEKGVLTNPMIHSLLKDYFSVCDEVDRETFLESLKEKIVAIIHTRDGAKAGMMCIWNGTAKQRKAILKSMKTHFIKIACGEFSHLFLLAAFDSVDDTVFMKKAVLAEIVNDIEKIMADKYGRKVIEYLIVPRKHPFFHKNTIDLLSEGDGNPHTKKTREIIYDELRDVVHIPVLQLILQNLENYHKNPQYTLFIGDALKVLKGEAIKNIFEKLAEFSSEPFILGQEGNHFLDLNASSRMISYIVSCDKERHKNGEETFSKFLVESADSHFISWTLSNRGCFLLVKLIETDIEDVRKGVLKKVKKLKEKLLNLDTPGSKILAKKIK